MSEAENEFSQGSPSKNDLREKGDEGGRTVKKRELHSVVLEIFVTQVCLGLVLCLLIAIGYWGHIGSLFFGLVLGSLGASVALLRRVQVEEVAGTRHFPRRTILTLMPMLYGCIMAGVTYLLFVSGILSGDGGGGYLTSNLFPSFDMPRASAGQAGSLVEDFIAMQPRDIKEASKLLVWCFVAGYSESFVFGVLSQLERRGDGESSA